MARLVETKLTISCLQCDWSVETTNTSTESPPPQRKSSPMIRFVLECSKVS